MAAIFAKNAPVYAYEFSPRSGPSWYTIAGYQWGAGHAADLTYLYPLHDGGVVASGFTPDQSKIADAMARYWGAFVVQGAPKAEGLPEWPGYASSQSIRIDQAVFSVQGRFAFRRAFARTTSFRMIAVRATFAGFPVLMRCAYFAFMSGLKRAATRAGMWRCLADVGATAANE